MTSPVIYASSVSQALLNPYLMSGFRKMWTKNTEVRELKKPQTCKHARTHECILPRPSSFTHTHRHMGTHKHVHIHTCACVCL